MPEPKRIVITGGPGSGKTQFFERLKLEAELSEFLFFEELARRIISDQPHIRHHPDKFHREIYRRQIEREETAGARSLITDRGTVDAFAFHPETMTDVGTTLEAEYRRYSLVVQLGSAAALGEDYYVQDEIRQESVAEALVIESALRRVWSAHPGYQFLGASEHLEEKYSRFRDLIVANITGRQPD
jgi:predicted ATPase